MKKRFDNSLIVLIISFLFSFSLTRQIHADIGMVNWDPYYAWCIQKEGIIVSREGYGEESVYVPYGARLYIWHGDNYEKAYSADDSYFAYYGDYSFSFSTSIKGNDIRPVKKKPDPEFLTYENLELMTLADIKVYDGPSADYEKVDTLSEGATISSDYNDGMWAHITHDEKEGWIYFNQTSLADDLPEVIITNKTVQIISNLNEASLYNSLSENRGTIVSIPAESEILYIGTCSSSFNKKYYYVNFDDNKGWLIDEGKEFVFNATGSKLYSYGEITLYDDLDGSNIVSVIQQDEEIELLKIAFDSQGKERYCCRHEGVTGWTSSDPPCFVDSNVIKGHEKAFVEEETEVYKTIDGDKADFIVKENEQFVVIGSVNDNDSEWHYIKNADKEGWINCEIHFYDAEEEPQTTIEPERNTKKSIPSVIYYYVAGAFVIGISTFVLIRYLNLKKK